MYYGWNAETGIWERRTQSTRTTNRAKAKQFANTLQEFALKTGGRAADSTITRDFVLGTLNHILRLAGHAPVEETRKWHEYSQEWLNLKASDIKGRSSESYTGHVNSLTKWLGTQKDIRIDAFTGRMMQAWYQDAIDEGRKPSTVNNHVKTLQQIFDRARAEGFCPRNPAELIMCQYGERDTRTWRPRQTPRHSPGPSSASSSTDQASFLEMAPVALTK